MGVRLADPHRLRCRPGGVIRSKPHRRLWGRQPAFRAESTKKSGIRARSNPSSQASRSERSDGLDAHACLAGIPSWLSHLLCRLARGMQRRQIPIIDRLYRARSANARWLPTCDGSRAMSWGDLHALTVIGEHCSTFGQPGVARVKASSPPCARSPSNMGCAGYRWFLYR